MAWQNLNICSSFTETYSTNLKKLSAAQCCEVDIYNLGTGPLLVYDNDSLSQPTLSAVSSFTVPPSTNYTFRGITNSEQVSAKFGSGGGLVSYRTQYFSSNPLNIY